MKGFRLILAALFLGQALVSVAQKKKGDEESPAPEASVVYALPQTGVRIIVQAKETRYFHGPYYAYAKQYLGIEKAPSSDYINWDITSIKLDSYGEADPNATFTATGAYAAAINLSETGVLVGVNGAIQTEAPKVFTADFSGEMNFLEETWPDRSMHSFLNDDDTLSSRGWSVLSLEEKAREAAHDITKLRKRRFNTLAANYEVLPPDGKAYEVLVEELDRLEKEYVGLFIGKIMSKTHSYVFEVVPSSKGVVAFRFAPDRGVLPANDVTGKPVMLSAIPKSGLSAQQGSAKAGVSGSTGLNYRIPGSGIVRLTSGSTVLAETRMALGQFGTIVPVSDGLLTGDFEITFHEKTGAIRTITPIEEVYIEE